MLCAENCYFLIDCPGQVELFTMHNSLLAILTALDRKLHFRCARFASYASTVPPLPPLQCESTTLASSVSEVRYSSNLTFQCCMMGWAGALLP